MRGGPQVTSFQLQKEKEKEHARRAAAEKAAGSSAERTVTEDSYGAIVDVNTPLTRLTLALATQIRNNMILSSISSLTSMPV